MKKHPVLTAIELRCWIYSQATEALADPTDVKIFIEKPDGTVYTFTYVGAETASWAGAITRVSTGYYKITIQAAAGESGNWYYDWQGIGAVVVYSPPGAFIVVARQVTPS